jgi:hypothetical protein
MTAFAEASTAKAVVTLLGTGDMTDRTRHILIWTPRVLSLAVVWLAAKNLHDWVSSNKGFGENLLSVLVHLIPALIVLGIVALSWRREWIAGMFFVLLGLLRAAKDVVVGSTSHVWLAAFGVFLGLLFVLNWKYRAELRSGIPPTSSH